MILCKSRFMLTSLYRSWLFCFGFIHWMYVASSEWHTSALTRAQDVGGGERLIEIWIEILRCNNFRSNGVWMSQIRSFVWRWYFWRYSCHFDHRKKKRKRKLWMFRPTGQFKASCVQTCQSCLCSLPVMQHKQIWEKNGVLGNTVRFSDVLSLWKQGSRTEPLNEELCGVNISSSLTNVLLVNEEEVCYKTNIFNSCRLVRVAYYCS